MGAGFEIRVPDIGDFEEVEVVEILVAKGDRVEVDDPLVTIESDKATMEIPSSAAGVVSELRVAEGDRVSEGSVLVLLEPVEPASATTVASEAPSVSEPEPEPEPEPAVRSASDPAGRPESLPGTLATSTPSPTVLPSEELETRGEARPARRLSPAAALPIPDRAGLPHASPLVRRFARELGVSLDAARGSGAHGRILVDDLKRTVRERFEGREVRSPGEQAGSQGGTPGVGIPAMPAVDHAAFGPVREEKLTGIQRASGPALHRSWLAIPHVTQHDEADVTQLEQFRHDRKPAAARRGVRLSPLLFVMKAVVVALGEHPRFRSSLAPEAGRLIVKDYFHLGIAVDTPRGLVVPVIRDVDRKGLFELAEELAETSERARARKLTSDDMSGACFTISSLGGIGGTAFSPIVNAPEVAILGLSRIRIQPRWQGESPLAGDPRGPGAPALDGGFEPRLVLPLSLSYDHRVIDGAEAVRFTTRLASLLADPVQLLL